MTHDQFIASFSALKKALPRPPTHSSDLENSDYSAYSYRLKDCYFCFDCVDCERCFYCFDTVRSKDSVDCDYCVECELLYESADSFQSYNSAYLDYCARVYDSYFCRDCSDSHNLFGCAYLKQKQYCIFNKQYSKEAYLEKREELLQLPAETHLKRLSELIYQYPRGPTYISHSENSDYGNQVHYCKNCYLCFDVARSEDCGYMYDSFYCKNSFDLTYCFKAELCYECTDSSKIYNCEYVEWSSDCFDSAYLFNCSDCHNCYGCVGLKHKRYCISNRQYTKEAYQKLLAEIKSTAH